MADRNSSKVNYDWDTFALGRSHTNQLDDLLIDNSSEYREISDLDENSEIEIGPYVSAENQVDVNQITVGDACQQTYESFLPHHGYNESNSTHVDRYRITSVDDDLLKEIDEEILPQENSSVHTINDKDRCEPRNRLSQDLSRKFYSTMNENDDMVSCKQINKHYGTGSKIENGRLVYHDNDSESEVFDHDLSSSAYREQMERRISEVDSDSSWHCHDEQKIETDKLARNQLIGVCALCITFMIGEAIGGALSNSLALFTDVLHLASDLTSFLISILAIYLSSKPATRKMTFGYHRAGITLSLFLSAKSKSGIFMNIEEVLGALCSVFIIWLVTGVLCYIAVERILREHYKDVKPDEMLITAVLGVVFNIIMGIVLHSEMCCRKSKTLHRSFGHSHGHGHSHSHGNSHRHSPKSILNSRRDDHDKVAYEPLVVSTNDVELLPVTEDDPSSVPHRHKNINVRAAFIHVIGDIIQSVGVLIASLIIKLRPEEKYRLADPICTFLFSILVLFTTIVVLRDTLLVIMEGSPRDVNYEKVLEDLQSIDGVKKAHSLCIWSFTIDRNALAVHLAIESSHSHQKVLETASQLLKNKHKFFHVTIQVELYKPAVMDSCHVCLGPVK